MSVCQLAHIVGKLNSTALAVLPAPLHYRELQSLKIYSLQETGSYNAQTTPSPAARDDLAWWLGQLKRWNGRSFIVRQPEVVIQSDASLKGWGAVCQGRRIQGRWSFKESAWHINCLELKAATLAIQTFPCMANTTCRYTFSWTTPQQWHTSPQRRYSLPKTDEPDQHPLGLVSGPSHLPGICNVQAD